MQKELKVISYNVEFAKAATPSEIATHLKPHAPDVICFSEVPSGEWWSDKKWTNIVGEQLDMPYSYTGCVASANHLEKCPDKTGEFYGKFKSILSKTPLVDCHERLINGVKWRPVSAVFAKTTIDGKEILISSLHIPTGVESPSESCAADLASLLDNNKSERIIIAGDYNDTPESEPLKVLYKHNLKNPWLALDYDWENDKTRDEEYGQGEGVIDHMLYRGKLQAVKTEIIKSEQPLSDHHAIYTKFLLN
jgi:endonuclease/exonuclease/phosphatase family metal-dependent hydrolase